MLHDACVPVFLRYIERLLGLIKAAEAFADMRGVGHDALLSARLAPDMLPFERQVAIAVHFTLRTAFPLAGQPVPEFGDFPPSFAGLRARAERAAGLLGSLQRAQFEGAESRVLESHAGEALVRLPAQEFLFQYAMPNFFFHACAAYAVLRHLGVPLGKEDFDGFHRYATVSALTA